MPSYPDNSQYVKTVVISNNSIESGGSGGGLIKSLFESWPKHKLAQIIMPFFETGTPDFDACLNYWLLPPIGRVKKITRLNRVIRQGSYGMFQLAAKQMRPFFPSIKVLLTPFREWLCSRKAYHKKLEILLQQLAPEIVYALVGNYFLARAVTLVCTKLDIPLYLHVVDDYVTSLYDDVFCQDWLKKESAFWLNKAIDYASGHATIGPHMAQEYQYRYGHTWSWFTTLCRASDYNPAPRGFNPDDPCQFVYAGNVGLGRWRQLKDLSMALMNLGLEGVNAHLTIYTDPISITAYKKEFSMLSTVSLRPWVEASKLPGIFHHSDVLVHVESFDASYVKYTKWSLSTKISQYMMSGRPILAYGDPRLASIRIIAENNAGYIIGTATEDDIKETVKKIVGNYQQRTDMGRNGRRFALQYFDSISGEERFLKEIKLAHNKWRERKLRDI